MLSCRRRARSKRAAAAAFSRPQPLVRRVFEIAQIGEVVRVVDEPGGGALGRRLTGAGPEVDGRNDVAAANGRRAEAGERPRDRVRPGRAPFRRRFALGALAVIVLLVAWVRFSRWRQYEDGSKRP